MAAFFLLHTQLLAGTWGERAANERFTFYLPASEMFSPFREEVTSLMLDSCSFFLSFGILYLRCCVSWHMRHSWTTLLGGEFPHHRPQKCPSSFVSCSLALYILWSQSWDNCCVRREGCYLSEELAACLHRRQSSLQLDFSHWWMTRNRDHFALQREITGVVCDYSTWIFEHVIELQN